MMFFMVPSSIEDEEFEQTGRLTPCASASASTKGTWPELPEIAGSKRCQANGSRKQQPEWLLDQMDFLVTIMG